MRLVFEPGEKERIEERHGQVPGLFSTDDIGREFAITVEVTNPAAADYFLLTLMRLDVPADIDPGFRVTSVRYDGILDRDGVRSKLIEAIDKILGK